MLLINFFILCMDIFAANACSDGDGRKRCTSYSSLQLGSILVHHTINLQDYFPFSVPARCPLTTIVGGGVVINIRAQAGSGL